MGISEAAESILEQLHNSPRRAFEAFAVAFGERLTASSTAALEVNAHSSALRQCGFELSTEFGVVSASFIVGVGVGRPALVLIGNALRCAVGN
jgi:hypothetical protein